MEQQLEKVRKDLLDAATTAEKAEEARVEAEARESDVRKELEETLGCLEEVTTKVGLSRYLSCVYLLSTCLMDNSTHFQPRLSPKVALLESTKTQLNQQLEDAEANAEKAKNAEEQRKRLAELEEEVDKLLEEKGWALDAVNDAQTAYANNIAERDAKIETLHKDVDVHREQMELAQTMLEEKETLASELRTQLEEAMKEESMKIAQFEEDLAAKGREVSNITAELEERTKNVENLEERLEKVRKEFTEHRAEAEAAVAAAKAEASKESERSDKEAEESAAIAASNSAHAAQIAEQMAELAEKETQIERLERDLGTGKRQLEATRVELDEKDKHAERLKFELERIKTEKSAKVEELEGQLDEKNKSIESLRKDVETEKGTLNLVVDKMNKVQIDLEVALDATHEAEDARQRAVSEMEASKSDKEAAVRETESLKSQIETLQTANDAVVADVKALKSEADKERKSSAQAASTLAAKNAARQAELEMKIDKMQKDIDAKKREIDASKFEDGGVWDMGVVFCFYATWIPADVCCVTSTPCVSSQSNQCSRKRIRWLTGSRRSCRIRKKTSFNIRKISRRPRQKWRPRKRRMRCRGLQIGIISTRATSLACHQAMARKGAAAGDFLAGYSIGPHTTTKASLENPSIGRQRQRRRMRGLPSSRKNWRIIHFPLLTSRMSSSRHRPSSRTTNPNADC